MANRNSTNTTRTRRHLEKNIDLREEDHENTQQVAVRPTAPVEEQETQQAPARPSIRRKRSYNTQINWTYEMNRDIYHCLKQSSKGTPGYMARMKMLWDGLHPEYNHLTSKRLRDQADRVIKKGLVNEARQHIDQHLSRDNNQDDTNIAPSDPDLTEILHDNNTEQGLNAIEDNENDVTFINKSQDTTQIETPELQQTINLLKPVWHEYFEQFKELRLEERPYQTRKDRKIEQIEIKAVNAIMEQVVKANGENIDLKYINAMQYTSAVTLLSQHGKLRETKTTKASIKTPIWISNIQNRIDAIRRKLAHVNLILKCKETSQFTPKQRTIEKKLKKIYGGTGIPRLHSVQCKLKHDLAVESKKLKDKKTIHERQRMNNLFFTNPKAVYREFRQSKTTKVHNPPQPEDVKTFWEDILSKTTHFNSEAPWLNELKTEYCRNVTPVHTELQRQHFDRFIAKLKENNSPGRDLVVGFWTKHCYSLHSILFNMYIKISKGELELPAWLTKARTTLLPKSNDTRYPKNFRPIACENIMLKVYTGCIALLVEEHCIANNIISPEQAGARKGLWGCVDQLLINKVISEEVTKYRRNLLTIWLDYKKAYDSLPHSWVIESLILAKIPTPIINSIKQLISQWSTEMTLPTEDRTMLIGDIVYNKGLIQGDFLSVILFILSLNPLSFLLNKVKGYKMGPEGKRDKHISHLFFVDDLKTYSPNINTAKLMLDIITTFSHDIGMEFGEDKCGYINVEHGKRKSLGHSIKINNVTIKELKAGETYKYLGQEESIGYDGPLNMERVTKEFYRRVKAIWSSELNAKNKTIAHNCFAIAILIPTIGILDWTLADLERIDIKTRKILSMTGNFHVNSDKDRLYVGRQQGGRGLKNFEDIFTTRIVALRRHLIRDKEKNHYLENVENHEQSRILRIGEEYEQIHLEIQDASEASPRKAAKKVNTSIMKNHKTAWQEKEMHGYVKRKISEDENNDMKKTNDWLKEGKMSSHTEAYLCAIEEQEITTKFLTKCREKDLGKKRSMDSKCRLCKTKDETTFHILGSCPHLSSSLYLHTRHNQVAKVIFEEITSDKGKDDNKIRRQIPTPQAITKYDSKEIWWDLPVSTTVKVKHNRPDIVMWDNDKKQCTIIDVCVPLDINISKQYSTKRDNYTPLISQLQRLYPSYTYSIIPIIMGALGTVPKALTEDLQKLGIKPQRTTNVTKRIQKLALLGSLKIMKTFKSM